MKIRVYRGSLKLKQYLLFACIALCGSVAAHGDEDHGSHKGHSDALLFLLQHKIAITKLQNAFNQLPITNQQDNLRSQASRLKKAMPVLQSYVDTPEGHYPNMEIYHQSLQSRAALIQDYTHLLTVFQQQSTVN